MRLMQLQVYKELRFTSETMDVCYLTQWVSIYQMLFGFVLMPLLLFPGLGSADGQSTEEIIQNFLGGFRCFAETEDSGCQGHFTFLLMWLYVGINFCFNTLGLWLTKHAGAVLNSISYALLLPLTTVSFSFGFLGPFRETAHLSTFAGLAVVLIGFALWRYFEIVEEETAVPTCLGAESGDIAGAPKQALSARPPAATVPDSFQERVICMACPHRTRSTSKG
mmetsp:Transcript_15431/g.26891  ORF Transcript_15431/g.26891 Transcript_15431/m.26891 type:complete len:222 (-) Transcript_15431:340-1005(-)